MEDQNNYNIHLDQNRPRSNSPQSQKSVFQHDEDEIDLREYVNIILKKKWGILAIFLIVVIIVFGINMIIPETFEATAIIKIGQIRGKILENVDEIKAVFSSKTTLDKINQKLEFPLKETITSKNFRINSIEISSIEISSIEINSIGINSIGINSIGKSNFVVIKGWGETPESALAVANALNEILLNRHQKLFAAAEKILKLEFEIINKNKKNIEKNIEQTEKEIVQLSEDGLKYEKEITKRANIQSEGQVRIVESYVNLLANSKIQKADKESETLKLKQKLIELDQKLQQKEFEKTYQTIPTITEVAAVLPDTKIAPNRKQNMIMAGILGLFVGVFWAFGAEYFSQSKKS
ncbi:hypothetical protein IID20_00760 [Patescibacteria group bacterium]|nr:hypothetical protein [Patescibacteria group bacterium]